MEFYITTKKIQTSPESFPCYMFAVVSMENLLSFCLLLQLLIFPFRHDHCAMEKFLVFIGISLWAGSSAAATISGVIPNDTQFYYRQWATFPSKSATIRFLIAYLVGSLCDPNDEACYPRLDIYTTEEDRNFAHNCSADGFGQVDNDYMALGLPKYVETNKTLYDENVMECGQDRMTIYCSGKIDIQDYIPRSFAFSFGFKCSREIPNATLRDLKFDMTIEHQTNAIQCISTYGIQCHKFYNHTTLPNLVGYQDLFKLKDELDGIKILFSYAEEMPSEDDQKVFECHQHLFEVVCYLLAPQCIPETSTVVHLCKEMCHDIFKFCADDMNVLSAKLNNDSLFGVM